MQLLYWLFNICGCWFKKENNITDVFPSKIITNNMNETVVNKQRYYFFQYL